LVKRLVFFLVLLISCSEKNNIKDNATSGQIAIACDHSFVPIVKSLISVFENDYPKAKIKLQATSENNAKILLKLDSVQLIIVSSDLDSSEQKYFRNKNLRVEQVIIGYDGIAFIVNSNFSEKIMNIKKLKNIFLNADSKIRLLIDEGNSSNYNYMLKWLYPDTLKNIPYACNKIEKIVDYIRKDKNLIGIVGFSHLSEDSNPIVEDLLKKIDIIGIEGESVNEITYPYQDYLVRNIYPFKRPIRMIFGANYFGLAKGFAAFAAGPKGQRIVLKFGLIPETLPTRDIKLK
jgi:phosphate transport system substrate-binding protein